MASMPGKLKTLHDEPVVAKKFGTKKSDPKRGRFFIERKKGADCENYIVPISRSQRVAVRGCACSK
jgi:hypothetical protein